ncbi:hypothetical protein Plec18167_007839 [Paecilomyces lecythidis]|uniref:Carboxylesterase type B domain-containing protein n=1 Tax=Paecilomyces lecythidis TaxID=3004212 RepID=A0ABR3X0R1_9EURO
MQFHILLPFLGLLAPVLASEITVSTSNGPITGHRASKSPDVIEYLGIPYAAPPVGDLRFAAPQSYQGQKPYVASNYSSLVNYPNKTAQFDRIFEAFAAINNNTQSEDCLSLNIWAKSTQSQKLKPVLVHFYGGRWTSGTTHTPFYYGGYLADAEDIIVVTVNYRMNIFGFPGIPNQPSNLGLLDQRKAVEWLRDNIKAFGGDPSKIVISGQSCGSASVDYWPYAYEKDPIVAGLISHSGTVFSFPVNSQELSTQNWYNVSRLLGCGTSGDVLPCMRQKSVSDILAAAGKIKPPPATSAARKQPVFEPTVDGVTVFDNYENRSANGDFAHLPYLVGHNDNEAGFYKIASYAQGANLSEAEWQDFNIQTFTCPTMEEATNHVRAGVPTWRFRYFADWNNTRLYPTSGAYHGVDMNMIFGNSADVTGIAESRPQTQLKRVMQHAWAAFVTDPEKGLEKLGWPVFDPKANTLVCLGYENKPNASFVDPQVYDSACSA